MTGPRRDLRGPGYMRKGGRVATVAHNELQARPSAAPPAAVARRAVQTCGRGSDRAAVRHGERLGLVCVAAGAAAAAVASVLELVVW